VQQVEVASTDNEQTTDGLNWSVNFQPHSSWIVNQLNMNYWI
jgi:hypothetical protein